MAEPRHVLIVEDDELLRECLHDALAAEGYRVSQAADGRAALTEFEANRPDLIVLDLMMPLMDGWAFRAAQRRLAGANKVPVVILSAAYDAPERLKALGAAAVLQKPFDLERFFDLVARLTAPPAGPPSETPR